MTKILSDFSGHPAQRQSSESAHMAQRFQRRLQWEKSYLQSCQACQDDTSVQHDSALGPSEEIGIHSRLRERVTDQDQNRARQQSAARVDDAPLKIDSKQTNTRLDRSIQTATHSQGKDLSLNFYQSERVKADPRVTQQRIQSGHNQVLPNFRPTSHQCLHIYQQDGKLEVALRQSGLTARQGMKLLHELRQDMAKLGLRLARLMLNGELFWQVPQRDHPRTTKNTPIDKIY